MNTRWVRPTLAALMALQLWSAMSSSFTSGATVVKAAALLCAVLAVFGLPSLPLRVLVWTSTAISLLLLARFGMAGSALGVGALWRPLLWLVVTGLALAVTAPTVAAVTKRGPGFSAMAPGIASVAVALAAVAGVALLVGPRAAGLLTNGSTIGETIDRSQNHPGNPLDSTSTLDMTTRPQLSDRVVMTVASPVASFWRSEVFDVWDGVRWTRSAGRGGSLVRDGVVTPPPEDLSGNNGEPFETEMRIEAGYATALPVAPSAVQVSAPGHQLAERSDGTIVSIDQPLGRGATYRVTSRQLPLDAEQLVELGRRSLPTGVTGQYAQQPVATQRTVELARRVTGGLDSNYTKVLALQRWMGDNTRYDINAPLSPPGVDVVDNFLFESQLGWCEQIASSLVVMARAVGIPARLATGYVPGEWDALSGRFIVREEHAHSWAEIWFPEVGWVPFDPTADVPLAGSNAASVDRGGTAVADLVGALLLVAAVGMVGGPPLLGRARSAADRMASRRRRRRLVRDRWDVAEEESIESAGAEFLGRDREPAETLGNFAQSATARGASGDLEERAEAVERLRYGPGAPV